MKRLIPFLILLSLYSCKPEEEEKHELLTLLPHSSTNIEFINLLTESEDFNMVKYLYFNNGAGVAAGDINNDGLTDLYFTSNQNHNKLYLNKGNLVFEDITYTSRTAGTGDWKTGVTMADVNGDGKLDIYVCQLGNYKGMVGRNQLFINQGNLTFKDEAYEYGLDFQGFSTQAAFFDHDLDGDLDMYLLNHSVHSARSYGDVSLRLDHDSLAGDRLYRNEERNGKRFFKDITTEAGIYNSQIGYGLGVNVADITNDGFPDIYISNDFHENDYLYINNGDGTFTERLNEFIKHTTRSSMGNDVGDFNNDGLLDIAVLDMVPEEENIRKQSGGEDDYELFTLKLRYGYTCQFVRNVLQLNLGGGMFSEIGLLAGITMTDWSWSPLFCDVDNDGWKDLFISNGIYRRANDLDYVKFLADNDFFESLSEEEVPDKMIYEKMPLYPYFNYIFKNNRDLTFTNMAGEWGITKRTYSNGATYSDLDNDGDLELITNNINDYAHIYRNNSNELSGNHFLCVILKGEGLNTRGVGARVTIFRNGQMQIAEQFSTRGFSSATSDVLHFGLGPDTSIDSLVVRWPDLSEQVIKNPAADKTIILEKKNASRPEKRKSQIKEDPDLFIKTTVPGINFRHTENRLEDFSRETLIPHSLFAEGPTIAAGDLNGDGLDDIFAGGARGQESVIYFQQPDGSFIQQDIPVLRRDIKYEDVDAAIFDADGDNDNDLYIVRGGNDVTLGNTLLDDRLLINNGNGILSESVKGSLPFTANNGSCVRPCDFDGDGDTDLFVGSISIPGAYGLSPDQLLLENTGRGHFKDVTDERMKRLKKIGMVTDACWIDYDNDGDFDLVMAGEWMRIYICRNDNGKFTDVTNQSGLQLTSGWWTSIRAADIDGDGDQDLIGGNMGLNSVMKASPEEPVEMYINDFDNNGILDQIICSYQEGISFPLASLDELVLQIPELAKKYPNYYDFGGKTIRDMFDRKILNRSIIKEALMFESSVFLNDGEGRFETVLLPVEAQFSPVRDIIVRDFNVDGLMDLILVGNDYTIRPSMGRFDASYGWYLQGDGKGAFNALMPFQSGLKIDGDARKILYLRIGGKNVLVTAINNDKLQMIECSTSF